MDITHEAIVPLKQEENGVEEHYNATIMNAVRKKRLKAKMD